jgi:hypothetical protein
MRFQHILCCEAQSTMRTAATLSLEQQSHPARFVGVAAQASRSVHPLAVPSTALRAGPSTALRAGSRAFIAPHPQVADDERAVVSGEGAGAVLQAIRSCCRRQQRW